MKRDFFVLQLATGSNRHWGDCGASPAMTLMGKAAKGHRPEAKSYWRDKSSNYSIMHCKFFFIWAASCLAVTPTITVRVIARRNKPATSRARWKQSSPEIKFVVWTASCLAVTTVYRATRDTQPFGTIFVNQLICKINPFFTSLLSKSLYLQPKKIDRYN